MSCEQQTNLQESGNTRSIELDNDSWVEDEHRDDQESRDPPSPLRCSNQYRSTDVVNVQFVGDSASTILALPKHKPKSKSEPKPKATAASKTELNSGKSPPKSVVENNDIFTFRFLCIATVLIVLRALVRQSSEIATLRNHVGDLNYALLKTSAPKGSDGDVKYLLEEIEYLEENTIRLEEKVRELNHRSLALEKISTGVSYDANVVRYLLDEVKMQEEHSGSLDKKSEQTTAELDEVKAENKLIKNRLEIVMKDNAYLQSKYRDQKISMENMHANTEAILLAFSQSNEEDKVLKEAISSTH